MPREKHVAVHKDVPSAVGGYMGSIPCTTIVSSSSDLLSLAVSLSAEKENLQVM